MSEKILDAENWRLEANAVINDVKDHVSKIMLSEILLSTDKHIYLNLTTKENTSYCIELSGFGFRIVGDKYDMKNINCEEWFETPYSLLNKISPLFCDSFGNLLSTKLRNLE